MKNIFFDRDGIINEIVYRENGISSPRSLEEFQIRNEFIEFYDRLVERLSGRQCNFFVFSNQPDVSRGLLSAEVLQAITDQFEERFRFQEVVYCTHDDSHHCQCRKPKPGMLVYLLEKYNLAKDESVAIGDSHKDILAAAAAGVPNILLETRYNTPIQASPDFTVRSLNDIFLLDLGI